MRRGIALFGLFACVLALSGCGGSSGLGFNSAIRIHLRRTNSAQLMTQYEVYITKNADPALNVDIAESYASTTNRPSWSDEYKATRNDGELELDFKTRSTQTPYYVFVKVPNTGNPRESVQLQIDVDTQSGKRVTRNLESDSTQRLFNVQINRNSATY